MIKCRTTVGVSMVASLLSLGCNAFDPPPKRNGFDDFEVKPVPDLGVATVQTPPVVSLLPTSPTATTATTAATAPTSARPSTGVNSGTGSNTSSHTTTATSTADGGVWLTDAGTSSTDANATSHASVDTTRTSDASIDAAVAIDGAMLSDGAVLTEPGEPDAASDAAD